MYFRVHINFARSGLDAFPSQLRRTEAVRNVKMFLIPRGASGLMFDSTVPDELVTDAMVERYLELVPPKASVIPEFQEVINEIERAYVLGLFFSTVSASCVSIERMLNLARTELHAHHSKVKQLWGKGPLNDWENIAALKGWGYLEDDFAPELRAIYKDIRCQYLHSGTMRDTAADALRSARAAYRLINVFLGFPENLFRFTSGIECLNMHDPRFVAFYQQHVHDEP